MPLSPEEFFTKWYNYFSIFASNKLSRYAGRYIPSTDPESLDYLHDAYIKATRIREHDKTTAYERFEGEEITRRTWFCVLIVNCMKDRFKSARGRLEVNVAEIPEVRTKYPSPITDRNRNITDILRTVKGFLPSSFYKILLLRTLSLSCSEISEILGIPLGTVTSNNSKIRAKLKHFNISSDIL